MAGKPRAECKIVSEEVWARARDDYLSGMTAPAVAKRHGMGGLRGRIFREGWSKAAHAARNAPPLPPAGDLADPPLDAEGIGRGALARASAALLAGRPAEATAIVQALRDVVKLAEVFPPLRSLDEARARNWNIALNLQDIVRTICEHLVGDGEVFERDARWAFAWRAEHLGPEAEARDRAYAERMGWTAWLYDAEGRLTPDPDEAGRAARLAE